MTNADRIRAMSDEELAGYLRDLQFETVKFMAKKLNFPIHKIGFHESFSELIEWLGQPAEE